MRLLRRGLFRELKPCIMNHNTMKKGLFLQSLICLMATSCSVEDMGIESPSSFGNDVFFAGVESVSTPDTRVYVDENIKIIWDAEDRISIFNKNTLNQQFMFMGETGDNSGYFNYVSSPAGLGNSLGYICSVYPYLSSTKISSAGVMTLTLPAEQAYREGTFGPGANTMVSTTKDNLLSFKNVGGYLVLKFYGEGVSVSSIKLEGHNGELLAGKATLTPAVGTNPTITMASTAETSITLNCDNPVELGATKENASVFWMVVPPTAFTKGFKLTVTDPDGNVFVKETSANLSITRNGLLRISPIEVVMPASGGSQSAYASQPLTFEIIQDGTITWNVTSTDFAKTIEYSVNGGSWKSLTSTTNGTSFNVSKGQTVRFRGNNAQYGIGNFTYNNFTATCQFNVKGNIMSLVAGDDFQSASLASTHVFARLFYQCSGLISAENLVLPASTLTNNCYEGLFYHCSSLKKAPELPAKSLADYCYRSMFFGCSSLESAPKLPVTSLAKYCYYMMFALCTSLTSAPALPATTLAAYCYSNMFQNCSSLTIAPTLPATTLVPSCYSSMFLNCTRLTSITCLAKDISASYCLYNWVDNVSASGTFTKASSMNSWPSGASGIPNGWTVKNSN